MTGHLEEATLNEYLDGVLDVEGQRAVETHVSVCHACRTHLQSLQSLCAALDSLKVEDLGRDLSPLVVKQLSARRPSLGWRLALAIQAGVAWGILIAALPTLEDIARASARPSLAFLSSWERFASMVASSLLLLWETIPKFLSSLNNIRLPLPVTSSWPKIPLPLPVALCLLAIIPVLWWIGSIYLLPDDAEVAKPL